MLLRNRKLLYNTIGERHMFSCPKCGILNDDDAIFCTKCGAPLKSDATSPPEQPARSFTHDMEQMGKKLGESMTHTAKRIQADSQDLGKRFEQRVDYAGKSMENWYNCSFGIFGPLLESFIFLIVFRVIIMVMELPNQQTPEIHTIATILLVYILPLFALTLLSNYINYFSKKYFKFKVFSPLLYAFFFVLLCWIILKILYDVSAHFTFPALQTAAQSLETSLPTIFIFVLLIGYVILILSLPRNQNK